MLTYETYEILIWSFFILIYLGIGILYLMGIELLAGRRNSAYQNIVNLFCWPFWTIIAVVMLSFDFISALLRSIFLFIYFDDEGDNDHDPRAY